MGLISVGYTFTAGSIIVAAEHNENFNRIYTLVNGNLENVNIKASAAIVDTKLAQITTASKVSGAALTSLTSIPSGAGLIPVANIDTGTTASKIVKLDSSARLPAVSGALLTNLVGVGTAASKSDNTAYQAATDGFFIGVITAGTSASAGKIIGYTDSSNPPTTEMGAAHVWVNTSTASESAQCNKASFCIPVKKNEYYKGVLSETHSGTAATAVYNFIPLGS